MKRTIISLLILCLIPLGCATQPGPKTTGGTLIGAGTGALIGSQIGRGNGKLVAVAIGTLAGAVLGHEVGKSLDRADELTMERNAQYSLENTRTNATTTWRNPDTGNSGTTTPVETYQTSEGRYCREYIQTVTVAGEEQQAYGTACRQPDGSWMVVK